MFSATSWGLSRFVDHLHFSDNLCLSSNCHLRVCLNFREFDGILLFDERGFDFVGNLGVLKVRRLRRYGSFGFAAKDCGS